jgi:hypothetical protein
LLSVAEMLLGLSRHLGTYGTSQPKADMGQLEFAGTVIELAIRLRGSGVAPVSRVEAMALDAGISKRSLHQELLPALESLSLVDLERDRDGVVVVVSETVPPLGVLFARADQILAVAMPEPVERMALEILEMTTVMPITESSAIEACSKLGSEREARRAIEDLESLHLCSRQRSDDGDIILFNPNVWAADREYAEAALRAEDGRVRDALSGLMEEVAATAGLPEAEVQSCEPIWINYAVSQGLLLRSLVATGRGQERSFLFAPHMGRSAFHEPTGSDPTGHVRQLIGSMVFARRYATNRLFAPRTFLNRLITDGEAGDASNIGTDYSMLETAGIVRVEKATNYYKFVLLQPDIAEQAITYLDNAGSSGTSGGGLRDQRIYRSPERERARKRAEPARDAEPSVGATASILAALRQEAGRRRYGR